jgi:uncharacterized repeat protein (TIGR02543 family)
MKMKKAILSVFLASTMLFTAVPVPAASKVTVTIVDNKNTKATNDDSKYIVQVDKGSKISSSELQKINAWIKQGEDRNEVTRVAYSISLSSGDSKALKGSISKNMTFKLAYKQINPIIQFYDTVSKSVYAKKACKKGEGLTYPTPPNHEGYAFDQTTGWSVKRGTKFNAAKTYTVKANYRQTTYVIQFDGKGATSGSMKQTKSIKYTEKFTLPANTFKKTGYVFTGWKLRSGGAYIYKNKASVTKLTNKDKAVLIFEAVWEKKEAKEYKISYILGGANPISGNPKTYKVGDTIKLKNPAKDARAGYTFKGWTYNTKNTPITNIDIRNANMGDITFVANWEPIVYYIQFKGNGANSGSMNKLRLRYGIKSTDESTWVTLPKNKFQKTGYIFNGWEYNGNIYRDEQVIKYNITDKPTTLTFNAKWVENKSSYTITYILDGGIDNGKNPTSYTSNTKTFKLVNPTREGYIFDGWSGTGLDGIQKNVSVMWGSKGNKTFIANWTPIEYTIVFNKNNNDKNGEGVMDAITVKYDEEFSLPACEFTRLRYLFDHWEYNNQIYEDEASVSRLTSRKGQKITLKAIWKINPDFECMLNFRLNGGELNGNTKPDPIYAAKGETITLEEPVPPKGKAFDHWTCSGNGTIDGDSFTFGAGLNNTVATVSAVYVKANNEDF